jgi:integrase/recombinase XerD
MTNVFVGTGCRLGSCINLKVTDIDFNSVTIYFSKMKNRKALLLPLNNALKKILADYISFAKLDADNYLFPSSKGEKFTDTGFCATYADYAERRNVKRSGIHKFRHTYAKQFILQGGNPAKLQRILGHSSIEITMAYVNLYSVDLKDDVNSFCFLNKLNDL